MKKAIRFFVLGLLEFRSDYTTNPGEYADAYDSGRAFAHAVTMHRFDRA